MMWILHVMAFIFFIPALFITIPLHIIISIIGPKEPPKEKTKADTLFEWAPEMIAGTAFVIVIIGTLLGF